MISYLKGMVAHKDGYGIVLDVAGVGYALSMSSKSLAAIAPIGGSAQVWTYLQVKDDGISLFGFSDIRERELFERLIGVSGVGPKMAIAALSTFDTAQLASCISAGDVTALSRVPGIGKKTAQRVVLELQGVLKTEPGLFDEAVEVDQANASDDVVTALVSMGFSTQEASSALEGCKSDDVAEAVRYALKRLGGTR